MSTNVRDRGVRFTELMSGFVSLNETEDFELGYTLGESESSLLEFVLTITLPGTDRLASGQGVEGEVAGTVLAPRISDQPLISSGGRFELFYVDPDRVETRTMRYSMQLGSIDGRRFHFEGVKVLRDRPGASAWEDTTRLPVTLRTGDERGPIAGRGMLRLSASDFLRQLSTMATVNTRGVREHVSTKLGFCRSFVNQLRNTYGRAFADTTATDRRRPLAPPRPLRAPRAEARTIVAGDGAKLRLERHRGGEKGPVLLSHGLAMSNLPFTLTTVETNLVEFLCERGYDVWLFNWRSSTSLPASRKPSSFDDVATHDYRAAVDAVLEATGAPDLAIVAHCMGATTTLMALLSGSIEGKVRSVFCLQGGLHMATPTLTRLKARSGLPKALERAGSAVSVHSVDACATVDDPAAYRAIDLLLKAWPVESEERCHSRSCKRSAFLYGELVHHDNLNAATHDLAGEMVGHASLQTLAHVGLICEHGRVVAYDGEDTYLERLDRLALPITFVHSQKSGVFRPGTTRDTFELLSGENGPELYRWRELAGYGHLDALIGKNAHRDVFPLIAEHLEAPRPVRAPSPARAAPAESPGDRAASGATANGKTANGNAANGKPANGKPANGKPANGTPASEGAKPAERREFPEDERREFADGEVIFAQGDDSRQMYVISSGEVEISQTTAAGEVVVARLRKGGFFGEMSLLESQPRSGTARAKGKTRLVVITPGSFLVKIRRDPTFALEVLQVLSGRVRAGEARSREATLAHDEAPPHGRAAAGEGRANGS